MPLHDVHEKPVSEAEKRRRMAFLQARSIAGPARNTRRTMSETDRSATAVAPLPTNRCPFDPDPQYQVLRTEAPVSRASTPAGFDVWLVSRYEDARRVLADGDSFSNVDASSSHLMGDKNQLGATPPPGVLLRHDGDSHSRLRL